MAEKFEQLSEGLINFIGKQHLFFVGTAAKEGYVNVSPKGMDSLRVLSPTQVVWLNLTGSGNETAAHLLDTNRMTIMFCSFDKKPLILRLYGQARAVHPRDAEWPALLANFDNSAGARQFFVMDIELVLTSCGYAVPFYEFTGERQTLSDWAEKKGQAGIEEYWQQNNVESLNGFATGIFED
ncbi:pyridoxamine 5'-phosphate oxidase family protein [Halioxenophilus sp. WMMB6]|uniref:pyridoxamine 5'-phosphate oxidase family protein n=1 Tax=Halioxenophilus sp. WMMB6 TaxID=3073815 RepID=UPI00295E2603|nr:pyridoxamine 5'-phosphate oxidase family protein [Halioxenophilus sp. WMMB6]